MDEDGKIIELYPDKENKPNLSTHMVSSMMDVLKNIDDQLNTFFHNNEEE